MTDDVDKSLNPTLHIDVLALFLEAMDCPKTQEIQSLHREKSDGKLWVLSPSTSTLPAETNAASCLEETGEDGQQEGGQSKTANSLPTNGKQNAATATTTPEPFDLDKQVTKKQFVELMTSAKLTQYEAVKYDIEQACKRFKQIADHDTYPISTLINRDAFNVLFAEKAEFNKTSKGRVVSRQEIYALRKKFFYLASVSKSVIFARAEPAMKKKMVTEIQMRVPQAITLAVGDGANDSDMIKAAHVGIGIAGVEGTAAVNAADYAIGDFSKLHLLLFCHGYWSVDRMCKLVYFMFYKAVLLAMTQYYFGFASGFLGRFSMKIVCIYSTIVCSPRHPSSYWLSWTNKTHAPRFKMTLSHTWNIRRMLFGHVISMDG
eukprot:gb/GEZN01009465.1/.p1 GENE.gb/GEZN01009465.1/~~gb/GEZN01009465.1/.p1  ORF type:complete len:433 (-),score=65.91 gb/GEZN01009465.1/:28-1152(-)